MTDAPKPIDPRLDRIAAAIEAASYPGREGPYGLYDYSRYTKDVGKPHVVRDFRRHLNRYDYGRTVFASNSAAEAQQEYDRLTREDLAKAAVRAVLAELPGVADFAEPLTSRQGQVSP